jgi:outer membrane protein assembly factor BamB
VSKLFYILLILLLFTGCSSNKKNLFWSSKEPTKKEDNLSEKEIDLKDFLFENKVITKEFNQDLKIKINNKVNSSISQINFTNNNGQINFDSNLKQAAKYKFSKIKNFNKFEPEISFYNEGIIFFDNNGSIINFDADSQIIWKKNYYAKSEKKLNPILQFANNDQFLVVADNIAKYYLLDIKTGDLVWSKNNIAPFNSQVKIYKDKFFIIDYSNTLRCFSLKDGRELWNIKTQNSLIRSQKKLSIVISKDIIFFNNSIGDITAVDLNTEQLLWQLPTQNRLIYESSFSLKTSELISDNKSLFFSNNKNQLFSIDIETGSFNWKTNINSSLRSTIINDNLFSISSDGFLFLINKNDGNIIRITDIFSNMSPKEKNMIEPTGFIIGLNNIYVSTNKGKIFVVDIANGKTSSYFKINREKILRPLFSNGNLFTAIDNALIKLN